MYWYTFDLLCQREVFPDTETVVGSLLSLAVYFSWQYILVGSMFWVCCWIAVSGKSKFVGSSVSSVISWLLLCVPLNFPPLNTTMSSCLLIQALKRYQMSDTTCESSLQQGDTARCATPNEVHLWLRVKPLDAAIGWVHMPYCPGGHHGRRFRMKQKKINKTQLLPSFLMVDRRKKARQFWDLSGTLYSRPRHD